MAFGQNGGAFGKDRERASKMNLRQQFRRSSKKAPKTGGGGGGGQYYFNKYQPPVVGAADIIRLIPGKYPTPRVDLDAKDYVRDEAGNIVVDEMTFVKYIEYYHGTKQRSCIGSEGPLGDFKGKGEPCVAGDWFWWEWRQRQKNHSDSPKAMSRRERFAVTALVCAPFYKVPQVDGNGQLRVNETTKEPYYEWKKGSKRGNDELAAAGYERKEGHLQHWSLGTAHWKSLIEYSDSLAHHCRACGNKDCIREVALVCQSCGDAVVEFENTSLSDEDIDRLRNEEVQCPHCQHFGYLEDIIECTQCGRGEQATLFDFDLEVKRVETTEGNSKQTSLQILRAIGPKPIDPIYGEDLRKPLDLVKIFSPTPIQKQIELFGQVPPEDGAQQGQASPQRQPSTTKGSRSYGT